MVIFLEQWQKDKDHTCALVGLVIPVIALLIFGADSFMIPAMIGIMAALTLLSIIFVRNLKVENPGRKQQVLELAIGGLYGFFDDLAWLLLL